MKIAILDLETDPFEFGEMIHPFVAGFYDGTRFITFWSPDCVARMVEFLAKEPEQWTIFAHNGGRFDWFYFLPYITREVRIVNNRIIQAHLGYHELRDSFAIMPFALEKYKKTDIDYMKFKSDVRDGHKEEILSYLRDDCTDLYDLCTTFIQEFGNSLTIGGAAMKELRKFHKFDCGNQTYDETFRDRYYFGGRNQVFKAGHIAGPVKVYDVNSMYPFVMDSYLHPVGNQMIFGNTINEKTCFVEVEGINHGAFATREKNGSLNFTRETGVFCTTIHEFNAALETGSFEPHKIIETIGFDRRESFSEFVQHFYNARLRVKAEGDKIRTLFYKFVLNSAYGKFAQNPENYSDWYITEIGRFPPNWHECSVSGCIGECKLRWVPTFMSNGYVIWSKPILDLRFYNIATGASITGAARAVLLKGLSHAVNPYYCDTDSILCNDLVGVPLDENSLGAWKLEATGATAAICGKKLYAIYGEDGKYIKKANKGVRITGEEIFRIAEGETIEACNPVPSFKWDGTHTFTKRKVKRTAI